GRGEGLLRQLDAFQQQGAGVGDHAVEVAAAELVPLGGRAGDATLVARRARRQFGPGQHHGRGAGAEGEGGQFVTELFLGGVLAGQALEGLLVGQVRGLAVDDQGVVDLAALDHAAGDVHAVDEGQAGVGDVEVLAGLGQAEVAGDDARGGRLEVVAADGGVDQQADLVRIDAGIGQRLHAGKGGDVRGLDVVFPQVTRVDAGDVAEHVGLDPEAVEGRLEPRIDLRRGQPAGSVDVGQAGDGDVLEEHGRAAMQQTEPYRVPLPAPVRMI